MKYRRAFSCVLLALLLVLTLAPAAFAEVEFGEDSISGEHDATVFLAGSDTTSTAKVKGILFSAGMTVSVDGESEYAFIAGNTIALNGDVGRDAFIAGNTVGISGNVARDLYAAGNLVNISGTVGRDIYAGGKNVSLGGEIGGNVYLSADNIQLADDLKIGGTLRFNENAKVTGPKELLDGAVLYTSDAEPEPAAQPEAGTQPEGTPEPGITITYNGSSEFSASTEPAREKNPIVSKLKSFIFTYIGLLLVAYFFLWLTPLWEKQDSKYTGADFGKYAATFGIGLAVLIVVPIATIILMITGIGVRPALVMLFVYIAALVAAPVFLGFVLGSLLWRKAFKRPCNYWAELAIGILAARVLVLLPFVSFAVKLVSTCFGLGAVVCLLGKSKSKGKKRTDVPALPEENVSPEIVQ